MPLAHKAASYPPSFVLPCVRFGSVFSQWVTDDCTPGASISWRRPMSIVIGRMGVSEMDQQRGSNGKWARRSRHKELPQVLHRSRLRPKLFCLVYLPLSAERGRMATASCSLTYDQRIARLTTKEWLDLLKYAKWLLSSSKARYLDRSRQVADDSSFLAAVVCNPILP